MKVWRTAHTKNEAPAFVVTGATVEGFTQSQLAHYIAQRLGKEGTVSYSYKIKTADKWTVARINAFFNPEDKETKQEADEFMTTEDLKKQLEEIFKMKEDIYKLEITKLKLEIEALQTKLKQTEQELEEIVNSEEPEELISSISGFLNNIMKPGAQKPGGLKDYAGADISGIPAPIVTVLNEIDYARLTPDRIEDLAQKLRGSFTFFQIPIIRKTA